MYMYLYYIIYLQTKYIEWKMAIPESDIGSSVRFKGFLDLVKLEIKTLGTSQVAGSGEFPQH